MAAGELTGATAEELPAMKERHEDARLYNRNAIEFEVAFCLRRIGKQPDDYDGPDRFCKRYAARLTREEWENRYDDEFPTTKGHDSFDERAYHTQCQFHGRSGNPNVHDNVEVGFTNLKHGMYAENWRLAEDFSEADAAMFDYILSWADIYGWPDRETDPGRYDLLEQFAYDRVRSLRAEEYFEEIAAENDGQSEIEYRDVRDDEGVVVGEVPVPNALGEDLRLLRKDMRDQMKELGLTPKSRGKMDALEEQASAHEAIGQLADEALKGDHEYDPTSFSDGDGDESELDEADTEVED